MAHRPFPEGTERARQLRLPPTPGWRWQETDLQEELLNFRPFEIKTLLLLPPDPKRHNGAETS